LCAMRRAVPACVVGGRRAGSARRSTAQHSTAPPRSPSASSCPAAPQAAKQQHPWRRPRTCSPPDRGRPSGAGALAGDCGAQGRAQRVGGLSSAH
jgi:hypothetical protein